MKQYAEIFNLIIFTKQVSIDYAAFTSTCHFKTKLKIVVKLNSTSAKSGEPQQGLFLESVELGRSD